MPAHMRGSSGELRRAYLTVARLGNWSMLSSEAGLIEARVSDVNDYHVEQGGLTLALRMGRREWVWSAEVVERDGDSRMVIRVDGTPTVRDAG